MPATFFVPAVSALLHPDEQRRVVAEGHEIGIHGWIHERNIDSCPRHERDLQLRAADTLEKITGPAPGRHPHAVLGLLRRTRWRSSASMGLLYDSSLMADDDPYELLVDGEPTGIVELPVEWIRDDAVYFNMNRFAALRPYTPPSARARDLPRASSTPPMPRAGCSCSPCTRTSSATARASMILEELIQHIRAQTGIWFATHADVVRYVKQGS